MDLLIQNARLRGREGLMEIAISGSKIEKIAKNAGVKQRIPLMRKKIL